MATKRAAFQLPKQNNNIITWFLSGHQYVRMKINNPDQLENGPVDLPGAWTTFEKVGWVEADAFLSDSLANGTERAFVFNGDQVMNIKIGPAAPSSWPDSLLEGSHIIADKWKALDIAGFAGGVDAVFRIPSTTIDEAWFFRGYQCVLIRYIKDAEGKLINTFVRDGPVIIATRFPGLGEAGFDSVDCVLNTTTDHVSWFFKGTKAVRINTNTGEKVAEPVDVHTQFKSLGHGVGHAGFYP